MFKVWYKSIFSLFIILILFLNLAYFTNLLNLISNPSYNHNYSSSYFGFTSIYDFFTGGFIEDNSFLTGYYQWISQQLNSYNLLLYKNWVDFSNSGGVYDIATFFTAVGNFFGSIGAILGYLTMPLVYSIYLICLIVWILLKFLLLMNGTYWTQMPQFTYA